VNIIFAGTPEFAASHLDFLLNNNQNITAVLTQPDRPAGRGNKMTASAVKQLSLKRGLRVLQPASLKSTTIEDHLVALNADLIVVVAYGVILPKSIIKIPTFGCINVHASLLPKWRGAAPIQRAIEAGEKETGVSVMQIDEGLDTGPVICQSQCFIKPSDTAGDLLRTLSKIGCPSLLRCIELIKTGSATLIPQDHDRSSYAPKITKSEAFIDWSEDAQQIERKIRAFNPSPVAYTTLNSIRIKIWRAQPIEKLSTTPPGVILSDDKKGLAVACRDKCLRLLEVQFPGKSRIKVADLLNSNASFLAEGNRLGT
jgi:methionyl-tRNA formyltransferase